MAKPRAMAGLGIAKVTLVGASEAQLSRDELRAGVASLSRRLDRHLAAWDAGDQDAMFDVASVTRTLLANGRGDKALRRLCAQERLPDPRVFIRHRTPPTSEVVFAFGGFPADRDGIVVRDGWVGTLDPGYGVLDNATLPSTWSASSEISLFDWLQTMFFTIAPDQGPHKQVTWEKLVTSYGNAYGSHLGVTHPIEILQTELFTGHGRSLAEHGLWLAAAAALNALADLLPEIGETPPTRRRYEHPIASLQALAMMRSHSATWQHFALTLGTGLGRVQLLKAPFMGKTLELWAERATGPDGNVQPSIDGTYR